MLKEIFVNAYQSKSVSPELRSIWSGWLKDLFEPQSEPQKVEFRGIVVRVLLGRNEPVRESIQCEVPFPITSRDLTEPRIQDLIELVAEAVAAAQRLDMDSQLGTVSQQTLVAGTSGLELPGSVPDSTRQASPWEESQAITAEVDAERLSAPAERDISVVDLAPSPGLTPSVSDREQVIPNQLPWPPPVNSLGMIGQDMAVAQLMTQVAFSRAAKRRFPDKLLVGPAGVGKSSLARAISRQLLDTEEILFNGGDLKSPSMIIAKLRELGRIPQTSGTQVRVAKCLIFIDEVHAISRAVAVTLLSALDDKRITTVDRIDYDFNDVVFMLATTDPGKLSEAFNSRPDKTYLRPYTLHELAGIIWLHGKEALSGYQLPKDVCYEIAARMRCQPRRAVRELTQVLIPYFFSVTHGPNDDSADFTRIAQAMTLEAVAKQLEAEGYDINGLDSQALSYLRYLGRNGATSSERLAQGLGISNHSDFLQVDEYLIRLGLIEVSAAGRNLTSSGRRYLDKPFNLRERISRQM